MKTYRITYAWTFGDITEDVKANTAREAYETFLHNMHIQYIDALLRAACFKVISVVEVT